MSLLCDRRSLKRPIIASGALALLLAAAPTQAAPSFTAFESGQVRPLSLSPDGSLLFVTNTPDNRLEIFCVGLSGLSHIGSVAVGLEPVAVAARSNDEVWVVNHLSDSVSVVDVTYPRRARVKRTLLVGDEPRDIVFAGPSGARAFITAAHRGQHLPFNPQLTTPGVGRADVWVFDANALGSSLGGAPLTVVTLFTDTPRALAVTPDGARVYAAGFHTGNQTTSIHRFLVTEGGGLPGPTTNYLGEPQPDTALIVKFDGEHWRDTSQGNWDDAVKLSLPDKDVFAIDAMANPPAELSGAAGSFSGVGTILYNMAVNPVSGKVYVANTEAFNQERFEGPGTFAGTTVRGHFSESRITVLDGASVSPRHLNKHINYATCCAPIPNAENDKSLATPLGMAVTGDGATLYVAAMGSSKIGVFQTTAIENDTFVPSTAAQIPVSGGGPTGLVLDEPRHRIYALTRFDNALSVIDTLTRTETAHLLMHNPEPPSVTRGRRFLYDASFTSSHGDVSCASCHVFGDEDSLAWDLGNPDIPALNNPGPFTFEFVPEDRDFRSLKGPMATQSLRGMANHGPMHWRGDRTGGNDAPSAQPDSGSFDERAGFEKFQAGFVGLLGRSEPIPASDMEDFSAFILQVMYPPNPIRSLDNSLTPDEQAGRDHVFIDLTDGPTGCTGCHTIDPNGNAQFGVPFPGFFGTDGQLILGEVSQPMKIPHFRNLYQRVGMFGMGDVFTIHPGDNAPQGDQIRGFGFTNDGSHDTLFRFNRTFGFDKSAQTINGYDDSPGGNADLKRRQVEKYLLAFDSNLAPIVGQQVTLTAHNGAVAGPHIALLKDRAAARECELVARYRGVQGERGFLYLSSGLFAPDRQARPTIGDGALRVTGLLVGGAVTYTCVPPGSGVRLGLDRDGDGALDGDEDDAGTDPANPLSHP